ncbi:uncharacterized protein LOC135199920 [Macrobrachium nipponense]|uniref:uncharacterized protein LOC135199920 n=1 Tax=Macrobrachium nipponense TaxID=159736 RepID=UPI0030C876A7
MKKNVRPSRSIAESETVEDTTDACRSGQSCRKELENWIQSTRAKTNDFTTLQLCDEVSVDHLTKNDLKILTSLAPVWAVQSKSKSAPITQSEENLLLHALKLQSPPQDAVILPYDEIVALEKQCPQVFLDLSWRGVKRGTTYIQMKDLSPASEASGKKAFFRLCTGEGDKSFVGSNMTQVLENNLLDGRERLCWKGDGRGVNVQGMSLKEINITPGLVTCSRSGNSLQFSVWYKSSLNLKLDPYSSITFNQFPRDPYSSTTFHNTVHDPYSFPTISQAGVDPYSSGTCHLQDKFETLGVVTKNPHIIENAAKHLNSNVVTIIDCGLVIKSN